MSLNHCTIGLQSLYLLLRSDILCYMPYVICLLFLTEKIRENTTPNESLRKVWNDTKWGPADSSRSLQIHYRKFGWKQDLRQWVSSCVTNMANMTNIWLNPILQYATYSAYSTYWRSLKWSNMPNMSNMPHIGAFKTSPICRICWIFVILEYW